MGSGVVARSGSGVEYAGIGSGVSGPRGVSYAGIGVSGAVTLPEITEGAGVAAGPGAGVGYSGVGGSTTVGAEVSGPWDVSYAGIGVSGAGGLCVRQSEVPWTEEEKPQAAATTTISKSFTIENDN